MASTTTWQSLKSASESTILMRSDRRVGLFVAHGALLGRTREHLGDEIARFLRGARPRVGHQHVHAAGRSDLHDAAAHRAGADDAEGQIGPIRIECHCSSFNQSQNCMDWAPNRIVAPKCLRQSVRDGVSRKAARSR